MSYKRLTNNNLEEYNPEYDFCIGCVYYNYFDELKGCNRENGICDRYERFIETYNRLAELEDKIERGELVENTVITYVNMARSGAKTLIDKALKFDKLKAKIENGTLIELPCLLTPYYLSGEWHCKILKGFDKHSVPCMEYFHGKTKEEVENKAEKKLKELKNTDNESFDCGYHEHAKEEHDKRVADTPNRIDFAKKQFGINNIDYTLKNEATGHFHCWRKSDNKLFQFYAGTGKIVGESKRGIHALIEILTKQS